MELSDFEERARKGERLSPKVVRALVQRVRDAVAERDAALAAIERVRETLSLHNPNGRLVKEVLAAIDEAPEPEMEYRVEYQIPGGHTFVTNAMATFEDAYDFMLENIHGGTVMSRSKAVPAGPWLPVEGEKP